MYAAAQGELLKIGWAFTNGAQNAMEQEKLTSDMDFNRMGSGLSPFRVRLRIIRDVLVLMVNQEVTEK